MAINDDIGGIWRTVGGRRIFIKDGQDLATAMRESGKFSNNNIDADDMLENYDFNNINKENVTKLIENAKDIMGQEFSNKFKGVKIGISKEDDRSFYRKSEEKIYLANNADEYTIIHELGHKYYYDNKLFKNKQYLKIIKDKFSKYKRSDFEEIKGVKGSYYLLKDYSEFVSQYQTRIYKSKRKSSFLILGKVKVSMAKEYFSEGLKYYYYDNKLLKKKDKKLYDFIDKIVKGKHYE